MKTCSKCSVEKPLTDFTTQPKGKFGRKASCRECCKAYDKARHTARHESMTAEERKDFYKAQTLRSKYKMSVQQYDELLASQGGGCAVCGGQNENGKALYVDHDHACCPGANTCGKCVRGLLCDPCNFAEGLLKSDADRIASLLAYVLTHQTESEVVRND